MDGFYTLRMIGALQYMNWVKDLQVIMQVMSTTIRGICLFLILVLLTFTYFAIAGILLFKESDPYHFRNSGSRYGCVI